MRLTGFKDCKTCDKALVFGSNNAPIIKCNSSEPEHHKLFNRAGRSCAETCNGYNITNCVRSGSLNQRQAENYIFAGNSEFVMHSTKNNEDYTFNIVKENSASDSNKPIYFVNIVQGTEKLYAGILVENETTHEFEFKQGKKGNVSSSNISIKSLVFVINKLINHETVGYLEFYHTGKCGCCGCNLITSEQIHTGYCKIHSKYGDI